MKDKLTTLLNSEKLGPFPLEKVVEFDELEVWLKKEYDARDPLRSIKRKPAFLLLNDFEEKGFLKNKTLISASSGNLAIEIALEAIPKGYRYIAITPSYTPEEKIKILSVLGVDVVKTTEKEFCPREFTVFLTRNVAEKYRWKLFNLDQYYSWQNPLSHMLTTAKEIFDSGIEFDYIIVPVGSAGTISGITAFNKSLGIQNKIVGVQASEIPGVHIVVGESCQWSPENFSLLLNPEIETADKIDAYAFSSLLWYLGFDTGPSTGIVAAEAYKLAKQKKKGKALIIAPDSNFKYTNIIAKELATNKKEISRRYHELNFGSVVDDYISYCSEQNFDEKLQEIKNIYKPKKEGKIHTSTELIKMLES